MVSDRVQEALSFANMNTVPPPLVLPRWKTAAVLLGFPAMSTLLSLLLLDREVFAFTGLDFFTAFWWLITLWYLLQIVLLRWLLRGSGYDFSSIGFGMSGRKLLFFIIAFLLFAAGLVVLVEMALAGAEVAPERLSDFANLSPITTQQRIAFVAMALVGGMAEELVYRGFAIRALQGYGMNRWVALVLAAVPFVFQHGLKSVDQFWWFFGMGIFLGLLFLLLRRLSINIILHWLVVLSALLAVLSVLE